MAKKIGKLKTAIYIVSAIVISTFTIILQLLSVISGIGISGLFHDDHARTMFAFGIIVWLCLGFIYGLIYGFIYGFVVGFVYGLVTGISFWFIYVLVNSDSFIYTFVYGLGIGFIVGFSSGLGYGLVLRIVPKIVSKIGSFGSKFVFRLVVGIIVLLAIILILQLALGSYYGIFGPIFGLGSMIGYFTSFFLIRKLLPLLKKLLEAVNQTINILIHPAQLRNYSVGKAILSFIIFYILTILLFSLWYYAIYLQNGRYFYISNNIKVFYQNSDGSEIRFFRWLSFLYFSVVTIATVGYGDISPIGIIPQILVVIEILSGFGLVAFYLATIFQIVGRIEPKGREKRRLRAMIMRRGKRQR